MITNAPLYSAYQTVQGFVLENMKAILAVAALALTLIALYFVLSKKESENKKIVDLSKKEPENKKIVDLSGNWWKELKASLSFQKFIQNWKQIVANSHLRGTEALSLQTKGDLRLNQLVGKVYGSVPNHFGFWMGGAAFIASYLSAKKDLKGFFVCKTLEALATKIDEIGSSPDDTRCALVVASIQSGYHFLTPNFPQHKTAVCIEKKNGRLSIALLETMPEPGTNSDIDPAKLNDPIWNGIRSVDGFNNQELVFRAILKGCKRLNCPINFFQSNVKRQSKYGCTIFALQDCVSFLSNQDFFNTIVCPGQKVNVGLNRNIEKIVQLPPEFMIGTQSSTVLQNYRQGGSARFNDPLPGRKKSLQGYLDAHSEIHNYYISKKHFQYLHLLTEAVQTWKTDQIQEIVNRSLLTKINHNLFLEPCAEAYPVAEKILKSVQHPKEERERVFIT